MLRTAFVPLVLFRSSLPLMLAIFLLLALCLVSLLPTCSPATSHEFSYDYMISRLLFKSTELENHVKGREYPFESHIITSADGYILTYHRVPRASSKVEDSRSTEAHRYPVLLVHGILMSSAFYLVPKNSLAYKLADEGFDVWIANHRGNPYSKAHLHLNSRTHPYYWEFSFNEMGRYDLPAAVDFILTKTGKPSLSYIGFSMGTTMFWTFAHWRPDYMAKIDCMVGIAPIAVPAGLRIVMKRSTYGFITTSLKAMNVLHFFEFSPYRRTQANLVRKPCENTSNFTCKWIVQIICYFTGMEENLAGYKVMLESLKFMAAGTSIQSLYHLLQVGNKGEFQMFDYGDHKNMRYYGGFTTPPKYDLTRVTIPVYLIPGGKDQYSIKEDTKWLLEKLNTHGKAELLFEKEAKNYNHLDFIFAMNVNSEINQPLVEKLHEVAQSKLGYQKTEG